MSELTNNNQEYGADQIQILEGLEAVRKRPGMYIGSTSARGLHHLVYEIVDNAVDEALAGYCKNIEVTIEKDNSITVEDDGRGIPVGMNHKAGVSALEVVFTVLHAGGKFGGGGYKVSGGLHGVGASVVNALSAWLTVEVYHDGKVYMQSYKRGKADGPVAAVRDCDPQLHGTKVHFLPDAEIFEETVYDYNTLKQRLRETAFLTKGLCITLKDTREDSLHNHKFHYAGGIKEFVEYLNRGKEPLYPEVIYCEGNRDGVYVEVAMQHNDSFNDSTFSFVNNIITPEGGTHLAGFRNALTKTFNSYAREAKILKDSDAALTGDDIREGLTAIISIKIEEPQFEGQTKSKLGSPIARNILENVTFERITYFLEENKDIAEKLIEKMIKAANARQAARKAKEQARKGKNNREAKFLSGKLAPAQSKNKRKNELYLVEGDSAGGSAKQGRDRKFQAILPLRGKVINTEKATQADILKNEEISTMINTINAGVGADFNADDSAYDKIIIMTDADTDGAHIQILLLTFFYRYMRDLIKAGKVYIAMPPLYKVSKKSGKKDNVIYCWDEKDLEAARKKMGRGYDVQRYKGLGEMNAEQLWETTMNPETRTLIQVTIDDAAIVERSVSVLMGDKVQPRREWIENNVQFSLEDSFFMEG